MFGKGARIKELEQQIAALESENQALKEAQASAAAAQPEPTPEPQPEPTPEAAPQPLQRSQYKDTWNGLSKTKESAVAHVIGYVEEEEIRKAAADTLHKLQGTVAVNGDDIFLEIGCGVGRVGQALAPVCQKWIGCDVSSNMLGYADERLQGFDNYELVEISGFDLEPIADASVDVVYSTVVFMHLDEWERFKYVLEAFRVLKPGGRILVDNFTLSTDEGWGIFDAHLKMDAATRPSHMSKASTAEELKAYLDRAGFTEVKSENQGAWANAWGVKG